MLDEEIKYRNDPCAYSAIPYWKTKNVSISNNIKAFHKKDWNELNSLEKEKYCKVDRFFRIKNDLNNLKGDIIINGYGFRKFDPLKSADFCNAVNIIKQCYENINMSEEILKSYMNNEVYNENLWIFIDDSGGNPVAFGLADTDLIMKEGVLEWIQVLPKYRGLGLGQALVNKLLLSMKDDVEFATVSGNLDNKFNPYNLYQKCGFFGEDIWYIAYLK